ncbi:MAG: hypothetical protein ACREPI_13395 [Candidatus Dormibacterales bacterium]
MAPEGPAEGGREPPAPELGPACPFCGARDAEVISLFGTQALTMQCRCRRCGSYFEAVKYA